MDWDYSQTWYHGSPVRLTTLRSGSTITQDRNLARIYSHKATLVAQDTDAAGKRTIKHDGRVTGFLYRIVEAVQPGEVYPHPQTAMGAYQEWLTRRDFRVEIICSTQVTANELLTAEEIDELRRRIKAEAPLEDGQDGGEGEGL